jgi:hypothetical protein
MSHWRYENFLFCPLFQVDQSFFFMLFIPAETKSKFIALLSKTTSISPFIQCHPPLIDQILLLSVSARLTIPTMLSRSLHGLAHCNFGINQFRSTDSTLADNKGALRYNFLFHFDFAILNTAFNRQASLSDFCRS